MVVTNEKVLGKRIRDLHFKERYDVVISPALTARRALSWSPVVTLCSLATFSIWWASSLD
ncbi:hypothetical protein KCP71_06380 [Salmonella enterica subsp. enterica]|nr:hypothetical protein KCP71_06380 [Salmonella enterica subsp. enterica]